MDFDPVAAAIAVRETGGSGLQPAVEWLLQNLDSLTSLSAALLESTTSDDPTPEDTSAPTPEPASAAEDARQEQLTQTAGPVQLHAVKEDIKQLLRALGFDDDIIQTVSIRFFPNMMAMLQEVGPEEVRRAAVRIALTVKLSDEASNAGGATSGHLFSPQELLASLTSGSAGDDEQTNSSD